MISHINKLFSHFYEIFSQKISKCINNHDASHCWRPNMWQMCPSHVKIKIFRCRCRLGTEGESDGNHILKWDPLSNYHFTMIRKADTRLNISTPGSSPSSAIIHKYFSAKCVNILMILFIWVLKRFFLTHFCFMWLTFKILTPVFRHIHFKRCIRVKKGNQV